MNSYNIGVSIAYSSIPQLSDAHLEHCGHKHLTLYQHQFNQTTSLFKLSIIFVLKKEKLL